MNNSGSLVGSPFIRAGYYVPMVLANGVDFLQLDFSGSMTFKDHIKGYISGFVATVKPITGKYFLFYFTIFSRKK